MCSQLIVLLALVASNADIDLPNIVVIYSDDAGYADFGFQPNVRSDMKKLTPNIDSIARDGARFTNAYMAGCVCSPSRAGLMTGRYPQRFGFENNLMPGANDGLSLDETFFAKRLQQLGYQTGLVGKWHLGYPDAFHPNQRGFTWFYGLLQGSRPYFPQEQISKDRVIQENGKPTEEVDYVTDRFGDAACRFIEEHKHEPFFLFVSFTAPHGPRQPKATSRPRTSHISSPHRRQYAGVVVTLDDNVGKILDKLSDLELNEKTLVVFTNDNGGSLKVGASNYPLRAGKGTLWEGGTRVPWAMRWPGKIRPGLVIDEPVIALDLMPTFFNVAKGKIDPAWELDGIDLTARVTGREAVLPQRALFWRHHGSKGEASIRDGDWKLIHSRNSDSGAPQLFNLQLDPRERTDVSRENAKVVDDLLAKLRDWESKLEEPRWGPGSRK